MLLEAHLAFLWEKPYELALPDESNESESDENKEPHTATPIPAPPLAAQAQNKDTPQTDSEVQPTELAKTVMQPEPFSLSSLNTPDQLRHEQDRSRPKPIRVLILRRTQTKDKKTGAEGTKQEFMVTRDNRIPEYELTPSEMRKWTNKKQQVDKYVLQRRIYSTIRDHTWDSVFQDTIEEGTFSRVNSKFIYHVRTLASTQSTPEQLRFSNKHKLHLETSG